MTRDDDGFDRFERELRAALGRVDAPAGLAENVMARAGRGRALAFPHGRAWMGSLAASLLVAGLLAGGVEHRRAVERARADRDFARSLEISDRAMEQTREHLQKAGVVVD